MLVKFKRDFFGADGVLYRKGEQEYSGDPEKLPSDAKPVEAPAANDAFEPKKK